MQLPRILFTAPSSASGKTTVTCGILQALINRGQSISSFKCDLTMWILCFTVKSLEQKQEILTLL
ncbi:MAG: hypothetical protein ACLRX7_02860 [Acutalibacteraceae bacterium]